MTSQGAQMGAQWHENKQNEVAGEQGSLGHSDGKTYTLYVRVCDDSSVFSAIVENKVQGSMCLSLS